MKIFWVQKIRMILLSQQDMGKNREEREKKQEREREREKTEQKKREGKEERKQKRKRERKSNEGSGEWIWFPFIQVERDLIDDCEPFPSISFISFFHLFHSSFHSLSFLFHSIFFDSHFVLLSFLTILIPFWPWIRINCMNTKCNQQLPDLMMMTHKQIQTLLPSHYLLFPFLFLFLVFSSFPSFLSPEESIILSSLVIINNASKSESTGLKMNLSLSLSLLSLFLFLLLSHLFWEEKDD